MRDMTEYERDAVERTLRILGALEQLGCVEQIFDDKGVRWKAKEPKFSNVIKALRAKSK
jgi:hypothetical protein